ncbi:MAG: ribonuclease HII [Thermoanaerobaculia bacterium]|nr:ribonuclease HII [Thermoanaerobaculia bacterium]
MRHLFAEAFRLQLLQGLEERLLWQGFARVAGVDEVGRGCLAGPVVAAALIPRPGRLVPGVDDSKRLSPERRAALAERLRESSLAVAVVAVEPPVIDRVNILEATRRAMRAALARLDPAPDCALVDAVQLAGAPCPCFAVVRADSLSYAVAAASIVAKVERDRMMTELDRRYPHYGFSRNMGYGAPEHLSALAEYGPCPSHRLTFRSVLPRVAEA